MGPDISTGPFPFVRGFMGISNGVRKIRQRFAKNSLESELAQIITIAEEHKNAGLEPKHTYYKRLQARAFDSITEYTKQYGGTRDDIVMSVPKLRELGMLADGDGPSKAGMFVSATIGALLLGAFICTYFGFLHRLYMYVAH
jgi:hypothetical protein